MGVSQSLFGLISVFSGNHKVSVPGIGLAEEVVFLSSPAHSLSHAQKLRSSEQTPLEASGMSLLFAAVGGDSGCPQEACLSASQCRLRA